MGRGKVVLAVLFAAHCATTKTNTNTISDAFHHRGTIHQVELGKVVLYLQQTPTIIARSTSDHIQHELILELPATTVEKKLLSFKGEQYDESHAMLYCAQVHKGNHKHQVELVIRYDAQRVVPEYALFDSISQKKGLVITFYNKELLDRIQCNERGALRIAACTRAPLVVIDPGHGGHDCGASDSALLSEKDIVLAISKHVVHFLSSNGIESHLTRKDDTFVPLDERTTLANELNAMLLVSIHVNTSNRMQASGIETFCAPHTLLHEKKVLDTTYSDRIERIRSELSTNSRALADNIHTYVMREIQGVCEKNICDRGVKHSVGQVLLTSRPAVIVEVGFLSNPEEKARLASVEYQKAAGQGIARGIIACIPQQIQSF